MNTNAPSQGYGSDLKRLALLRLDTSYRLCRTEIERIASPEHMELALISLIGDVESARRDLVKNSGVIPMSSPFRVKVVCARDKQV